MKASESFVKDCPCQHSYTRKCTTPVTMMFGYVAISGLFPWQLDTWLQCVCPGSWAYLCAQLKPRSQSTLLHTIPTDDFCHSPIKKGFLPREIIHPARRTYILGWIHPAEMQLSLIAPLSSPTGTSEFQATLAQRHGATVRQSGSQWSVSLGCAVKWRNRKKNGFCWC